MENSFSSFQMEGLCFILGLSLSFPALRQNKQYFNPADTNTLVGAVAFGKGLSKCRPPGPVAQGHPGPGTMMGGASALQQATIGAGPVQQAGSVGPQQQGQQGKSQGELFILGLFSKVRETLLQPYIISTFKVAPDLCVSYINVITCI